MKCIYIGHETAKLCLQGGLIKLRPNDEIALTEDDYESIIDKSLFQRCDAIGTISIDEPMETPVDVPQDDKKDSKKKSGGKRS